MMMGKLAKRGKEVKASKKKEVKDTTDVKGESRAEEIRRRRIEQIRAKYRK